MLYPMLMLIVGFVLLIKGANFLVDGASELAKKFGISDIAIGLTIVAFGTSSPELVVNTIASLQNHQNIVFGNVIGSNLFNIFIILGIAGVITPLAVQSNTVWKEIPLSFIAVLLVFLFTNETIFTNSPVLSRLEGGLLLGIFISFLIYVKYQLSNDPIAYEITPTSYSTFKIGVFIILGLLGLLFGGRFVIDNAIHIATSFGMSDKLIGLTIVAAGTSLPELATSVMAAIKKNIDIAVGNIIGSNIFNFFLVLAICAVVKPVSYDTSFNIELMILGAGTLFLFGAMFTGGRKKLDRWEALLFILIYTGYMIYTIWQ